MMPTEVERLFRKLVRHDPAPHQTACAEALGRGKPVILCAPTGSGKSEAVWIPFLSLRGRELPHRMIHVLPLRALANQLARRLAGYACAWDPSLRVETVHGQRPHSVLFYADAIVATLDQVVCSYACAPLSLGVRFGNIPAGAIPGSLLVFDEVHTFEPLLGLQTALTLARRAGECKMPFVVMSGTLPQTFLTELSEELGACLIEAEDRLSPAQRPRRVTLRIEPTHLTPEIVLEYAAFYTKTIVVANTVSRALQLYEGLRSRVPGQCLLVHSRFNEMDRARKEQQIERLFGKDALSERALLVATQVVEVGLDISCDLLVTELAPSDALVQRLGRCARWGGNGLGIIFNQLENPWPYDTELLEATAAALTKYGVDGKALTWQLERNLVDEVFGPYAERWLARASGSRALASLAEANFKGNPAKAERAVRDANSVEVVLHHDPQALGEDVRRLPRCPLRLDVFQKFVQRSTARVWEVAVDRGAVDEYRVRVEIQPVRPNALAPGGLYVIHPEHASYDGEFGLRLGEPGVSAEPVVFPPRKSHAARLDDTSGMELWVDHAVRVVKVWDEVILARESKAVAMLADLVGWFESRLRNWVRLLLVLHDLGKLTAEWQRAIRYGLRPPLDDDELLARRGGGHLPSLPPHATVSAWIATPVLSRLVEPELQEILVVPSLGAIAHHHSIRSERTPPFTMHPRWYEAVKQGLALTGFQLDREDFNTVPPAGTGTLNLGLSFLSSRQYTSYVLLSRWVRLSDWAASGGGEDAIHRFEEWFRDL
jgi:CRISPR-associated endonuclease/helicase Cas3